MFPVTARNGQYSDKKDEFLNQYHWTNSFFTGMVAYAYELTKERRYLEHLYGYSSLYREKVFGRPLETMHDLGFLYSLYSIAIYKLTGDPAARETAIKAADVLAQRFKLNGRYIQAWGRMDEAEGSFHGWMIADCMMNLPLLYWAWQETGHLYYRDVANAHADTNIAYIIREDGTVSHAYGFDPITGKPLGERNQCAADVGTYWARGTSWQIYGYALAYRYTGEQRYLEAAQKVADRYLQELGGDGVPVWDFRALEGIGSDTERDPTAAVIVACGLLELAEVTGNKGQTYRLAAVEMVNAVCKEPYSRWEDTDETIIRVPKPNGEFAGGIWGDYFFMEAVLRLQGGSSVFW
ncbi:glycoside hydrolase family 88 protein [Paenibacillus sp. PL2-23]|uniref:glycoside hydrolase family 88 protein n=1 Tax=Paenibacillus sp. PL2-23 TaxID=2100729 RepID=UPI0030FB5911